MRGSSGTYLFFSEEDLARRRRKRILDIVAGPVRNIPLKFKCYVKSTVQDFLMVSGYDLSPRASNAGGMDSIPGCGSRSHMPLGQNK